MWLSLILFTAVICLVSLSKCVTNIQEIGWGSVDEHHIWAIYGINP